MLITILRREVIKTNNVRQQKICELYFDQNFNCVSIAKILGVRPQYVSKVLKGHPNYEKEKERRSEIRYRDYLDRKKTARQLRAEVLKEKEDYELKYLRHLQWQHSIEMSRRYLS